jgi:hypothetical protein
VHAGTVLELALAPFTSAPLLSRTQQVAEDSETEHDGTESGFAKKLSRSNLNDHVFETSGILVQHFPFVFADHDRV